MDTMVLDKGESAYLVNAARLVHSDDDVSQELAAATDWARTKSSPFVQWITGDFVESDKPNDNGQFWTAGDLAMSEYTITHAPLNMVHKFRQPIGFFASTKTVKLAKDDEAAGQRLKIQALSGLWTHLFPFETAQAEAADEAKLLFYSMECRGTHLTCGTDKARGLEGCGKTFEYAKVKTHCEHLLERSSVRHIVKPTFRGGALIVPPVRPGWKEAHASVLSSAVMQEAAAFAEQNLEQYDILNAAGADISATTWEQMMAMAVSAMKA